jgi:hypothetical protein
MILRMLPESQLPVAPQGARVKRPPRARKPVKGPGDDLIPAPCRVLVDRGLPLPQLSESDLHYLMLIQQEASIQVRSLSESNPSTGPCAVRQRDERRAMKD